MLPPQPGQLLLRQLQQHWLGSVSQLQQLVQARQLETCWQLAQQLLLLPLQRQTGLLDPECCLRSSHPHALGLTRLQEGVSYAGLLQCQAPACCHWSMLRRLHVLLLQLQRWMP